jgi:anti-sigma regulatory factor (Ser/Thr protein kinase)
VRGYRDPVNEHNDLTREFRRSFCSEPSSAAEIRGFVREECHDALSQQDLDAAVLLTSELVTNAMLHTDSEQVEVRIRLGPGSIRIGVRDDDAASPEPAAPAQEETSGRGLQIVETLSDTWGVHHSESGGKCIWFSMSPTPGPGTQP